MITDYKSKDLRLEIKSKLNEIAVGALRVPKVWVVNGVIHDHPDVQGSDAGFAKYCMWHSVAEQVNKIVNEDKEEPIQEMLAFEDVPEYSKLQKVYVVRKDGESILVSLHDMTESEIDGKITELRSMSSGLLEHAIQLEDYKEYRSGIMNKS